MQLAGAPGAGGNLYNTGLISGSYRGVIINGGTIFGAGYGIRFSYGSGNTVVNAGTIDNGVSFLGYGKPPGRLSRRRVHRRGQWRRFAQQPEHN